MYTILGSDRYRLDRYRSLQRIPLLSDGSDIDTVPHWRGVPIFVLQRSTLRPSDTMRRSLKIGIVTTQEQPANLEAQAQSDRS